MWIVQLALRRPYTFVVAALLLLILSPVAIYRTPVDIFPNIDIPVVSIVWQYAGLSSSEFEGRITFPYERVLTTTVNDIGHIESQTLNGIAVVKVFFQPKAKIEMALAQVTAISQTMLRSLPTGTTPPLIITYNASSVPILQLGLSSDTLAEQQLNDYALNFVRTALATIPGCAIPYPYGGKMPEMMVDIDPAKLSARGLSPTDVVNAISVQNLILPSGSAKIGGLESDVEMNASPKTLPEVADLPIKAVNGAMIYIRDVASVRAGFQVQTNIVHQDGQRGTLLSVYKTGVASTLDIVRDVKAALPQILTTLPPDLHIKALFDQSIFVRASVEGVLKEAVIAACLTALMILLFLGKWRHTVVICISIPLSIPERDLYSERARRDDQHHDPGRPRPGGGHPRRRCDGGDREHRSQPGDGQRHHDGDPGRRAADCPARARLDAVHLHRLRADVLSGGRPAISLRATRGSGGCSRCLRPMSFRGRWSRQWSSIFCATSLITRMTSIPYPQVSSGDSSTGSSAASPACGTGTAAGWNPACACAGRSSAFSSRFASLRPCCFLTIGQDFFPAVDAGQFRTAHACAHRNAHRGDGTTRGPC